MAKLDQFKGKINFEKDSPSKISSTLSALEDYLKSYEESDAAKIVEEFKSKTGSKSQSEKLLGKKFLAEYTKRTAILATIAKTFKKIREDLIDEQDTSIRQPNSQPAKSQKVGKLKAGYQWTKGKIQGAAEAGMDFVDKIKGLVSGVMGIRRLLPMLAFAAVGLVVSGVKSVAKHIAKGALKGIWWIIKGVTKAGKWITKSLAKVSWALGKLALSAFKRIGSWVFSIAKQATAMIVRGMKVIGKWMGKAFDKIKTSFSASSSKPKLTKTAMIETGGKASKPTEMPTKSPKIEKPSGSISSKIKSVVDHVKGFILKNTSKLGAVGKAILKGAPKFLAKATPFGIPFMAYDAYQAYTKSNSLTSFAVNFLNESLAGMIGVAVDDPEGKENPGMWVDKQLGDSPEEPEISESEASKNSNEIKNLGRSGDQISPRIEDSLESATKELSNINPDMSSNEFVSIYENHPVFGKYAMMVKNGSITVRQAIAMINAYNDSNTTVRVSSKEVDIHNINHEMLADIKTQAVAESTLISAEMANSVLTATRTASALSISNTQNLIYNQGPTIYNGDRRQENVVQG